MPDEKTDPHAHDPSPSATAADGGKGPQRRISQGLVIRSNRQSPTDPVRITVDTAPPTSNVEGDSLEASGEIDGPRSDSLTVPIFTTKLSADTQLPVDPNAYINQNIGAYKAQRLIGSGTMGFVYEGRDLKRSRRVAIKMLRRGSGMVPEPTRRQQFDREMSAQRALSYHPNVVEVYDVGEQAGVPYFVMEFMGDGNLFQRVSEHGPLSFGLACKWFSTAADAVVHLHKRGIVHRDIKPPNLMIKGHMVKLGDFGLVRFNDPKHDFQWVTESVGSPLYAAPEIRKDRAADEMSDIYSLGSTLYFALSSCHPYNAPSNRDIRALHKTAQIPDVRVLRPEVPDDLADVIYRCMQKDPASRYSSAEEVAKRLTMLAKRYAE